jgi:hypothetical protein
LKINRFRNAPAARSPPLLERNGTKAHTAAPKVPKKSRTCSGGVHGVETFHHVVAAMSDKIKLADSRLRDVFKTPMEDLGTPTDEEGLPF